MAVKVEWNEPQIELNIGMMPPELLCPDCRIQNLCSTINGSIYSSGGSFQYAQLPLRGKSPQDVEHIVREIAKCAPFIENVTTRNNK